MNDVFQRPPQDLVRIEIEDRGRRETITATLEHPFWVQGSGWTGAQDLEQGQAVELADGRSACVILVDQLAEQQPVFNFAVDGFHTYYVGELGVWVHNASRIGEIGVREALDFGRAGKQARLRALAEDDKLGAPDRGWIKQELNSIARGQRSTIRNPPGRDLAHQRGREAAKGYDYRHLNLQDRDLHRLQHKYDNFGRANAERPIP